MWLSEILKPQTDWSILENHFPYAQAMRECVQDPIHHAEGDVWTHTRMVTDALSEYGIEQDPAMRLTALFHDIEKPVTRVEEFDDGRWKVRHPHHARRGAATAWFHLWRAGVALDVRLAAWATILWHQKVFHLFSYADMQRMAQTFAAIGDWSKLLAFGRADNRGRFCQDFNAAESELQLLQSWIDENLLDLDPASRMVYFERDDRSPHYQAQEPVGSRVIVLSGLPGAGKDSYVRKHLSGLDVVSLDDIRRTLHIAPTDNQGTIIQAGLEAARVLLRKQAPFVWNATSVSKLQRSKIIGLCRDYDAHVSIHAFDRPHDVIMKQNGAREHAVPPMVIEHLARKWEPPTLLEAHDVTWV